MNKMNDSEAVAKIRRILGLRDQPAEPVQKPALNLSQRDIEVAVLALGDAFEGWVSARDNAKHKSHRAMFDGLSEEAFDLHLRLQNHLRQCDAARKDEAKPEPVNLADAEHYKILDIARFFHRGYSDTSLSRDLIAQCRAIDIDMDMRQQLLMKLGKDYDTLTLENLSHTDVLTLARIYHQMYETVVSQMFRKIAEAAGIDTLRASVLGSYAQAMIEAAS